VPAPLIRFEPAAVAAHLWPRLSVVDAGLQIAAGDDLMVVRRATAARARAALDAAAHAAHPTQWRRFECEALAANEIIRLAEGVLAVFPTLARAEQGVQVRFEFSAEEAVRSYLFGAVQLARVMLGRQARDLAKRIAEDSALLLAASPYLTGPALVEAVLQTAFRQACFPDGTAPRERAAFEGRVEQARGALSPALDAVCAQWRAWFDEARAVRRMIDDPRARALGAVATESRAYLEQLFGAEALAAAQPDWLRQIPRYLKAEERRWQRLLARRQEPPAILRQLTAWAQRAAQLAARAAAELRRPPQLDELRWWIREFRVSLIAQEQKTLGPVSSARLEQRAAAFEAWLRR